MQVQTGNVATSPLNCSATSNGTIRRPVACFVDLGFANLVQQRSCGSNLSYTKGGTMVKRDGFDCCDQRPRQLWPPICILGLWRVVSASVDAATLPELTRH